jgi:hypothetical protein
MYIVLDRERACLFIQYPTKREENSLSQAPVAYACNPSYSGGRDEEDDCSKPPITNSSRDPV